MTTTVYRKDRTTPQREAITAKLSPLTARIKRGIELFASKGEQVVWVATDRAKVPSCRHAGRTYLVVLHTDYETCNCGDREGDLLGTCKHRTAALISHARRVFYRVEKFGPREARSYALIETRAGVDRVILRSASCADVYHEKWARENPNWEEVA